MSADFPNEAARCQRFLSERAQSNFEARGENGPAATRPPCYLMQNTRSKDRVRGTNSVKRTLAQLGRAPGSGQWADDFSQLFRLALTCSTLGKSLNPRDLNSRPNALKFFHRWIKRWIKSPGGSTAPIGAPQTFSNMPLPVVILIQSPLPSPPSQDRAKNHF
jgi:hypothetical protein